MQESSISKFLDKIICGDSLKILKEIPNDSIDLIITSPPYFQQRDYEGIGIGNERTVEEYIDNLLCIFGECVRVLKKSGSIVFNIGDKYVDGNLLLIPYRFAIEVTRKFRVKLVNEVTWVKLNPTPMPHEKKLVPSKEPFFIFVKSKEYVFNKDKFLNHLDLFKEMERSMRKQKSNGSRKNIGKKYFDLIDASSLTDDQKKKAKEELLEVIKEVREGKIEGFRMKIKGIHSMPYGGQEGGRKLKIEKQGYSIIRIHGKPMKKDIIEAPVETLKGNIHPAVYPEYIIKEFIKLLTNEGDIVLDPFVGSGTTAIAAKKLGRHFIGIDISEKYCKYAMDRLLEIGNSSDSVFVEEVIY